MKRTKLRDQADKLFRDIVRARGRCERCGTTNDLQTAHVRSRRYLSIRWDLDNALCLCRGCHLFMTLRPVDWEQFCIDKLGAEHYEALRFRALNGRGVPDYEAIIARLKAA